VVFAVILLTPEGHLWLDMTMLAIIGFLIYPVINFIVIMALDLTGKKAIGTAAGFIGLFGYIGRTVQAQGFGLMLDHLGPKYGKGAAWQAVIWVILACATTAIVLLLFTWRISPRSAGDGRRGFPVVTKTDGPASSAND
jgi:MFS transporter, OPA family, glycerol-3-phosphate transporter